MSAGFLIVGACQINGGRTSSVRQSVAEVSAMGAFLIGMLCLACTPRVALPLRVYSVAAVVILFALWLPAGLRFLGFIECHLISTLQMEPIVFALGSGWLGWLA